MLTPAMIEAVVRPALAEDAPWGDTTSTHLIPPSTMASAELVGRTDGVLAGLEAFAAAFTLTDPAVTITPVRRDSDRLVAGSVAAEVRGPARALLQAERVGLNLVQRLSGIATLTRRYVDAVAGTGARIVDTRKTTPGLRALERHAVRCGGGHNHRFSLSDAVMVKDNHLAALGSAPVTESLRALRERLGHTVHLEVEVDRVDQIEGVLAAGVDTILLDNFSLADLRTGVGLVAGRALVEASGTVTLETVAQIAATGVDLISVGALTHSAPALDLGLDIGGVTG